MTFHKLISLALITALILPTSLSAGSEKIGDSEAPTNSLPQQSSPAQHASTEVGDTENNSSQPAGTVSRIEHEALQREHKTLLNRHHVLKVFYYAQSGLFLVVLVAGFFKFLADCRR